MASSQILILGSRGIVGSAIAEAAGDRAIKAARRPVASDTIAFDALTDDVGTLIARLEPSVPKAVVIAFGISGTHTCASDPVRSRQLNVDRVLAVAKGVAEAGSIPVLLSTDCVFDGSSVVWSEHDDPNPICEYGRQKLASERAVARLEIPYLIVRLSRVLADHLHRRDLLFEWCERMLRGETIQIATDQIFTPIAAMDVGRIVVGLIDAGVRGLIHVAGPEQVSSPGLFERLSGAAAKLGVNIDGKAETCRVVDLPGFEIRPACTMLSIKRLEAIIAPHFTTLDESVMSVAAAAFSPARGDKVLTRHV